MACVLSFRPCILTSKLDSLLPTHLSLCPEARENPLTEIEQVWKKQFFKQLVWIQIFIFVVVVVHAVPSTQPLFLYRGYCWSLVCLYVCARAHKNAATARCTRCAIIFHFIFPFLMLISGFLAHLLSNCLQDEEIWPLVFFGNFFTYIQLWGISPTSNVY